MTTRDAVAKALATWDYGEDYTDQVERHLRLEQADAAIEAARPGLHLDGFLDACRLFVPLYERATWDVLVARLRDRDGWEVYVDECDGGCPWWRYSVGERIVAVAPINYRHGAAPGYLVTFSWLDDDTENIAPTIDRFMDRIGTFEQRCREGAHDGED